jgi:hypothetical protein
MDLRPYNPSSEQIERAKDLACRGLLCYQPFIFSEALETGAGFEFAEIAEFAGMVYCPDVPAQYVGNKDVARFLIDPAKKEQFRDYNARLRVLYETFIDSVEQHVGPIKNLTFADIGCCSGYFPMSFAKRGSPLAVGFDRVDYSGTFELLNGILGTNARFAHKPYRGEEFAIRQRVRYRHRLQNALMALNPFKAPPVDPDQGLPEQYDVVCSIAVLVHLSDPLQHLAYLGQLARKAILVWTYTSEEEEELIIRYQSYNPYYKDDKFPYCFDVMRMSPALLRKSLELMGFTKIYPIENRPDGMPDYWFKRQRGYLAVRE